MLNSTYVCDVQQTKKKMAAKKVNKLTLTYGGSELNLVKSKTQAAFKYTPGMRPANKKKSKIANEQIRDFEVVTVRTGIDAKLDKMRAQPDISVGTHVWNNEGDTESPFIPTGYLYIEFKAGTDNQLEQDTLNEFSLNIRELVGPDAYRVATTPLSPNPVKCAMLLQKKRFVQIAEPEFVTKPVTNDFVQPSGRFISTQWHLENAGTQVPAIDVPNTVFASTQFKRGADSKVKEAWAFLDSLGNKNLKIAIIDTGFATDHPQLRGDGTKIKNTFNAATRSADVSPWFQAANGVWDVFSHGTSCAAVAAGAWDAQGILGSAPNARIIPIKLDILSDDAIVKAFEHAFLNGADIISCSLGFPQPVPLSTYVSNYITKVAREGRGGLGTPIFIAAGNQNPASGNMPRLVSDFAAHPNVICVTASNSLDEASSYSFFGPNAFICAPTNGNRGVGITTATIRAINNTISLEYTSNFGGTSSATPLSAGICALMLSANPNLSVQQIRFILKDTADKIGGSNAYDANGHSQRLGFGRINALKAVQMAAQLAGGNVPNTPPTPTPPANNTPSSGQRGKVTSKFLNVRNAPTTAGTKVAELLQGAVVTLLEKLPGWWRIGAGQFVNADFIQIISNTPAPVATRKGKVNSPTLNVRSGPSTASAKVAELKLGNVVSIFQTSPDGWHRIGNNQWVLGKYLTEV
jgi:subtilisin family serine protease